MAKTTAPLLPSTTALLQRFGERLRLARLRRRLTAKQVAERAGMVPMTLRSLEQGGVGVTIGAYLAVMQVLGVEKDLDLLVCADPQGRELQDARLTVRRKASVQRERAPSAANVAHKRPAGVSAGTARRPAPVQSAQREPPSNRGAKGWAEKSGFTSIQTLADLIGPWSTPAKRRR